jgi:hypothetical protein
MIPFSRFAAASYRIASRKMVIFWKLEGPFPPSIVDRLMDEALLPWAATKLAKRCWARGWEIESVSKPEWGFF